MEPFGIMKEEIIILQQNEKVNTSFSSFYLGKKFGKNSHNSSNYRIDRGSKLIFIYLK